MPRTGHPIPRVVFPGLLTGEALVYVEVPESEEENAMGMMSNTVSVYQYLVVGECKGDAWVQECLQKNQFVPIDTTPDQESTGWVSFDDHTSADFDNDNVFKRQPYYLFTLRRDQRKVPSALLKNLLAKECSRWLSERADLNRVPFKRKAEMRETLHAALITKTLPVPSTYDVVWNTDTSTLLVTSISERVLDFVEDAFAQAFEGLSLEPVHPMSRAYRVVKDDQQPALTRCDQAPSKDVLLQIKRNRWVGWDFLLWLMYQTSNGSSVYTVNQQGPMEQGESFLGYLQDRFVLKAEHEEGIRKSSITGPQRDFAEARSSVRDGKNIIEAVIHLEKDSRSWKMALKGDIFAFGSYACPPVQLEKDELTDPFQERIAAFYERMSLVETGFQLFDSIFRDFLSERITDAWPARFKQITEWLNKP
ncbi:MAG TPA: recombination-associated protein RdgC [Deltaproteobacteria bacterium]|nr:recombination-associated protein RdgC [Deltaproteobacteria bacterium]